MAESCEDWAQKIQEGDHRAIARAISAIERAEPASTPLLELLFLRAPRAYAVGITGSPGAGKSTLVERLGAAYRQRGCRIGILAVDPTSPFSGGAILGDRIRMQGLSTDPGVYIRSMATRGRLGGLAPALDDAVTVLGAAGCDVVLIETAGVGQDEVDVAVLADVTALLLVPGMGDEVQVLKAGIMEIADLFVINKADRAGVERLEQGLGAALPLSAREDGWRPRVLKTVATTGEGAGELSRAIEDFRAFSERTAVRRQRERAKWRARLLEMLRERLFHRVVEPHLRDGMIEARVAEIVERRRAPYSVVEELMRGFGD